MHIFINAFAFAFSYHSLLSLGQCAIISGGKMQHNNIFLYFLCFALFSVVIKSGYLEQNGEYSHDGGRVCACQLNAMAMAIACVQPISFGQKPNQLGSFLLDRTVTRVDAQHFSGLTQPSLCALAPYTPPKSNIRRKANVSLQFRRETATRK